MKPHRGVLILVFGILGLMMCPIFGIFAWVMGNADLNEMKAGVMDPSGEQLTTVGKVLGIVAGVLLCIQVLAMVAWILFMMVFAVAASAS